MKPSLPVPSEHERWFDKLVRLAVVLTTLAGLLGVAGTSASATDAAGAITRAATALHAGRDCDPDSWLVGRSRGADVRALEASARPSLDRDHHSRARFGAPVGLSNAARPQVERALAEHSATPACNGATERNVIVSASRARAMLMVFHI